MNQVNQRIKDIARGATSLFLQQGYSRTQINHIAKAVGVSVGSIYLDFAGKKEILHFVWKCVLEPEFADSQFKRPITDELFYGIENEITDMLDRSITEFESHIGNTGRYHFENLISDTFDIFARYAVLFLFVRRNQCEFPALSRQYKDYRERMLSAMTGYLGRYMTLGTVRRLENPELAAMQIMETLAWWAMDQRYIAFEEKEVSLEEARKVCADNLMFAYRRGGRGSVPAEHRYPFGTAFA